MIKSLQIHNYKSLRNVSVTLEPVTVLIGRSGSGKSNFVNAIRLLRDYLIRRDFNTIMSDGGWRTAICATGNEDQEKLSIEIGFDVPGFQGEFQYAISFIVHPKQDDAVLYAESLAIDGRMLFQQQGHKWIKPPQLVAPPQAGSAALGVLYGIPEAKVAHLALTEGIGCYDFPGDVLKGGRFDLSKGTSLEDSADNYLATFDAITNKLAAWGSAKEMIAGIRRLNSTVTSVELEVNRSHVLVGHQVGDKKVLSFKLAQESEGLRRFLAHLIALYQQPHKQVLIFEEPEKGIYPGALAVLVDFIKAFANREASQVILTTHSPELLSHFVPGQIRVVEMEDYETRIGPVAPEQMESLNERLMTADELLTVDEARIDPSAATA